MKVKSDTVIDRLRQNLYHERKRRGLTQKDLGILLGLTQTGYGSFERGRTTLRGRQLDKAFDLAKQWEGEREDSRRAPSPNDSSLVICETVCPSCGTLVPGPSQGMSICGRCGESLLRKCVQCDHSTVEHTARYCSHCGVALS